MKSEDKESLLKEVVLPKRRDFNDEIKIKKIIGKKRRKGLPLSHMLKISSVRTVEKLPETADIKLGIPKSMEAEDILVVGQVSAQSSNRSSPHNGPSKLFFCEFMRV